MASISRNHSADVVTKSRASCSDVAFGAIVSYTRANGHASQQLIASASSSLHLLPNGPRQSARTEPARALTQRQGTLRDGQRATLHGRPTASERRIHRTNHARRRDHLSQRFEISAKSIVTAKESRDKSGTHGIRSDVALLTEFRKIAPVPHVFGQYVGHLFKRRDITQPPIHMN